MSLQAHHAFAAEFDAKKPVHFEGTITKMEWTNPHVWLHMDVKKPDGSVENWAFEAGTPNVLFRRGFTKESLLPGTKVVVDGYQAKNGLKRANGRDLTFPDGRKTVSRLLRHRRAVRVDAERPEGASRRNRLSGVRRSHVPGQPSRHARASSPARLRSVIGPLLPLRMIG